MWMQDTESGKVRYYERFTDQGGKRKTVSVLLPDRKKETVRAAVRLLAEKAGKSPGGGWSVSFGEMLDRYKAHLAQEMKPQTARAAESQFRKIERQIGSETLLANLTAPSIREALFFDRDPSKYNERLKHVKAALRWAYREELIASVDFLDRLPKMRSQRRREALSARFLEADELRAVLDGMREEKWRLFTEFLVLSGLRVGEAIALLQSDVDLKAREISVSKTYALNICAVSDRAKTDAGNRSVYIQDELLGCIRRINAIMPRRRRLFFDDGGSFIKYESYAKYLRENTEKFAGKRLSPHALRHTHVALLAAAGMDLSLISRRIGHANSRVTRDVYMHITQRLREKDADEIRAVRLL